MADEITDTLTLGGIAFQNSDYSPPSEAPFGGSQMMHVHKLPGGQRVIDVLGADDDDITFKGFFFTSAAIANCEALDALRAAGQVTSLTYCGMSRTVIIKHFKATVKRYPNWVEYEVTCTPTINGSSGGGGSGASGTIDSLVLSDLSAAASLGGG